MSLVGRYFFLLSGENLELAIYEFQTVVSLFATQYQINTTPDKRIIILSIPTDNDESHNAGIINNIMKRITLTHFSCNLLFQINFSKNPPESIKKLISSFKSLSVQTLTENTSFSVITKRIGDPIGIFQETSLTQEISRFIGALILDQNPTKAVDLENPEEKFIGVISRYGFWFGQLIKNSLRDIVRERTSHKRPFFHPSSMNPILQRTLINLAALKSGDWMVDPFCGAGGALLEASRMGIRCVGFEIDRRIIWGAYQNLKSDHQTKHLTHLVFGDARQMGFKKRTISAIVTDPPYGTAASTQGIDLPDLLLDFFTEIKPFLRLKGRIVIVVPSTIMIEDRVAQLLNATYETFFQYVHRSLTRKILTFRLSN